MSKSRFRDRLWNLLESLAVIAGLGVVGYLMMRKQNKNKF